MYNIRVKVFRAIDDLLMCEKFMKGHKAVLEIFGITEITSANTEWFYNPNSYVIIAESLVSGNIVGGARIHVVGGTQPLPIEDAVGEMDASIYKMVEEYGKIGSGKLCGLWNAREVAGMGVSSVLTRAAISIAMQLNLKTLFIICAERTYENIFKNQGFKPILSLGKMGTFYYPKSDLLALTLLISDLPDLSFATEMDKNIIIDLCLHKEQKRCNEGTKNELTIDYSLTIE